MIRINGGQATLGANTFTGAQVAPSLALGGATIGSNALAVTGTTALGGSLLMGASTSITVASGGIVGVGFALDQQAAGDISTKAAGRIGFSSTSNPSTAPDTAFSRISAGIIGVGTGAAGSVAGSMQMAVLDFGTAGNAGVKWGASSLGLFNNSNNVLAVRTSTNSADASITAYSLVLSSTGTGISTLAGPLSLLATGGNLYFGGGGQGLLVSVGAGLGDGLIGYRAAAIVGFSSTALSYNAPDVAIARNGAGILEINNGTAGSFAGLKAAAATFSGAVTVPGVTTAALTSTGTFTSGAAAQVGTLTNAPAAGNPTTWIKIIDNGVTRYIPAW